MERALVQTAVPKLPEGTRIYAVSDIHGCASLLRNVFAAIDLHISRSRRLRSLHVFLGDYIDRGPDSCRTIDMLLERSRSHETVFLKGNHEAILFEALQNPSRVETWMKYGGLQTLMSYGLSPTMKPSSSEQVALIKRLGEKLPIDHRHFFSSLRPSFTCGDFLFVHAGVKPGVPFSEQREEDLLWIRDEFLNSEENFGKFIVHGHTPVPKPDLRPNRLNIDTGAYATGTLTLLVIEGDRIFTV